MKMPKGHSQRGASGAKRWMACPESVALSAGIRDEESDHAILGTAAHAVGEHCLKTGEDAWTFIGDEYSRDLNGDQAENIKIDKDMADAVQVYLDAIRSRHPDRDQGNFFVERTFYCPHLHPDFYGTSDCNYIDFPARTLHVTDYKHGAGIVVEVADNPQGMMYACGILEELNLWGAIYKVVIRIVQPRGFHFDGPVREWEITTDALAVWLHGTLIPAMNRTVGIASGEHCRFCPARSRACPQLMRDMDELEAMMKAMNGSAEELTGEQLARFLTLLETAKIVGTAAGKTAFARLQNGKEVPGFKLGKARANRVFKEELKLGESVVKIADAMKAEFGDDAFAERKLRSPAQVEELPGGQAFATLWAHKPDAGLTLMKADDARPAVSRDTKSLFTAETKKRKAS